MCVPNLVPIGPETATCIRLERYTNRHTLSYIDIDLTRLVCQVRYPGSSWMATGSSDVFIYFY